MQEHVMEESGWTVQRLAIGVGLVAAGVLVTFDAWSDIFSIAWRDEEATQVFLAPVVAAWLLAARWHLVARTRPGYSMWGPLLIIIGWMVSWAGYNNAFDMLAQWTGGGSIQSLWHGGALLVVIGCIVTVVGRHVVRRFWPVFLVLIFMVPVPAMLRQSVAIPLQTATASLTQFSFDLMGVAVERSGNVLHYENTPVAVAEACNGMRMIFVVVLVCYAVAFASPLRPSVRALIILVSPFTAILCNVIRLVPTVWVYAKFPTIAQQFHDLSAWVMVGVAFLLVMGLIRLLRWVELPVMQPPRPAPSMSA